MTIHVLRCRPVFRTVVSILCAVVGATGVAAKPADTMERLAPGVWIEGPGFEVTYGKTYDWCATRCGESAKCVMIEYYRPENKCNLYSVIRPRKSGGSSIVAIKRTPAAPVDVVPTSAAQRTATFSAGTPPDPPPRLVKQPTLLRSSERMSLGR